MQELMVLLRNLIRKALNLAPMSGNLANPWQDHVRLASHSGGHGGDEKCSGRIGEGDMDAGSGMVTNMVTSRPDPGPQDARFWHGSSPPKSCLCRGSLM
ncbi:MULTISPECIES: hypothetical protein [unclassified Paracoccus (in: a-proteobacteria)]|uniref:hypothetical protein n=1 Tax=unclassified Paracoccus (in: a-proteobacteria) TaxID=2688777 RepID=UPI0016014F00|nr:MULTISPECIES: hypothetical protein [unclassified Paracoccus (in: a-proteobacteria)]MBB1493361.1 hypothetical protein [Paracoccus sp. MC1854]MBB1499781.1 hypothetical protein [Paracoccus sp. MC1862]QQO43552.1 hypothetical protein JGR78_08730 [Paracoccus sp. MC1862]